MKSLKRIFKTRKQECGLESTRGNAAHVLNCKSLVPPAFACGEEGYLNPIALYKLGCLEV